MRWKKQFDRVCVLLFYFFSAIRWKWQSLVNFHICREDSFFANHCCARIYGMNHSLGMSKGIFFLFASFHRYINEIVCNRWLTLHSSNLCIRTGFYGHIFHVTAAPEWTRIPGLVYSKCLPTDSTCILTSLELEFIKFTIFRLAAFMLSLHIRV